MQLIPYIMSISRGSSTIACNSAAVPEVVVNCDRDNDDIRFFWPVSQHRLLCEVAGSDCPEFKVVNQYL